MACFSFPDRNQVKKKFQSFSKKKSQSNARETLPSLPFPDSPNRNPSVALACWVGSRGGGGRRGTRGSGCSARRAGSVEWLFSSWISNATGSPYRRPSPASARGGPRPSPPAAARAAPRHGHDAEAACHAFHAELPRAPISGRGRAQRRSVVL